MYSIIYFVTSLYLNRYIILFEIIDFLAIVPISQYMSWIYFPGILAISNTIFEIQLYLLYKYTKTMIHTYENWLRTTTGLVKPKLTLVHANVVLLFFKLNDCKQKRDLIFR